MNDHDFSAIKWEDVSEDARPVFDRELQRRWPNHCQALKEEGTEGVEKDSTEQNDQRKSLFSMEGRLGRLQYFLRLCAVYGSVLVGSLVVGLLLGATMGRAGQQLSPVFGALTGLAGAVVMAFQAVKRLHDLDRPGTHYWLLLVPIYGLYLGLLLLFKKGTDGSNRYGNNPVPTT